MSEVKKTSKTKKSTTKSETKEKKVVKKETTTKKRAVKETKEEIVLTKKEQSSYLTLSKIVKVLAKIGKIFLMIFVPFIFLVMILIPIIFKNYEINANIIKFGDVNIIVNEDKLTINVGNETHVLKCDATELDKMTTFLTENKKGTIITYLELLLLLFAIILVINIYILYYIEKIFENFCSKKTPFIEENITFIFRIALFLSALKFIDICVNIVGLNSIKVSSYSLLVTIITFVIYFIYKYAVKLQTKVDSKICE